MNQVNLYIYADESGVFDNKHNDIFVFGGVVYIGEDQKNIACRRYAHIERVLRKMSYPDVRELKATILSNKHKASIYRSLNQYHRFGVVVDQTRVYPRIYKDKKTKQRFLDYAFVRSVRYILEHLLESNVLRADQIHDICVFMDEHSTATNGRYELEQSLEQELKIGKFNSNYTGMIVEPLLPDMHNIKVKMRDSSKDILIRSADIVANHIYFAARQDRSQLASAVVLDLP